MATGPRFYMPLAQAIAAPGVVVPGAELNFYLTTSNTRATTYANEGLTVQNANPVVADAAGLFPDIFLDPTVIYKVVFTDPHNGVTPPHEYWTADPVAEAWPAAVVDYFDIPFEFLGGRPPEANEVMGMYIASRPQTFDGNFDGTGSGRRKAQGHWLTPPVAEVDVFIFKNNVTQVATMRIAAGTGAVDFFTTGGAAVALDIGEFLTFIAPVVPDVALANGTWTIPGYNT